jgi:hypothetical protein
MTMKRGLRRFIAKRLLDPIVRNSNAYRDLTNRQGTLIRQLDDLRNDWQLYRTNTDGMALSINELNERVFGEDASPSSEGAALPIVQKKYAND